MGYASVMHRISLPYDSVDQKSMDYKVIRGMA